MVAFGKYLIINSVWKLLIMLTL